MGLISSLSLLLMPLLRRDSSTIPTAIPIDSETKRLTAELEGLRQDYNARCIECEGLRKQNLELLDLATYWRRRSEGHFGFAQAQPLHLQNGLQQGVGLGVGYSNVRRDEWYHQLDCTPRRGRAGFLRGDDQ